MSSLFNSNNIGSPFESDVPTMANVYQSDGVRKARENEMLRGQAMWDASQNPMMSGIVPRPATADMFSAPMQPHSQTNGIQSLSGETISQENFTHKNMQPFFGGFMRQNLDAEANSSLLENYTGRGGDLQHKKETECFFKPTSGLNNICGMKDANDFYVNRIQPSIVKNNEFPIEQIRVGPGLNQGYTNQGVGGFQQADTRDYVMPPSIDELRTLTNQKVVYESRPIAPPKSFVTERGMLPNLEKNRPDTYHEQTPDQWLKTTGAYTGDTGRPDFIIKDTARVEYSDTPYTGVARSTDKLGMGDSDDFGKANIMTFENERDVTQTRTVINNVTSMIKAIIAPFTDVLKHGIKEYTVEHPRTFGSVSAQLPEKPTLYDPVNHVMRTTIKETSIHDGVIGNLTRPVPNGYAQDIDPDQARKTIKETTGGLVDTIRNVGYHKYKTVVYNPDDIAKRTIREATGVNNNMGNVGGSTERAPGAYTHIPITVYATQKQFISDHDYMGISGSTGDFRPMSEENAQNMIIDATRESIEITERMPTPEGAKTNISKDAIDMHSKRQVSESLAPRLTSGMPNHSGSQYVLPISKCNQTKPSTRGDTNQPSNRLDPGLLSAFNSNPYTKSLASVA